MTCGTRCKILGGSSKDSDWSRAGRGCSSMACGVSLPFVEPSKTDGLGLRSVVS